MGLLRVIGWILMGVGLVLLAQDIGAAVARHGAFHPATLGEVWFRLDRASLNLVQAVIQRYVAAWLWDPVAIRILLCWAFAVFMVPGAVLVWLGRPRAPMVRRRF